MADRSAEHATPIALLELGVMDRIVEEMSEVGDQAQPIMGREQIDLRCAERPLGGQPARRGT